MILSSNDGKLCMLISETAIRNIQEEISKKHPRETGGILVGHYDANFLLATVAIASSPPEDSVHRLYSFERGVRGINELIETSKKKTKSFYIGEWHTHPNSEPYASYADLWQMNKFASRKLYGATSPILLIVGGNLQKGLKWQASIHKKWRLPLYLTPIK